MEKWPRIMLALGVLCLLVVIGGCGPMPTAIPSPSLLPTTQPPYPIPPSQTRRPTVREDYTPPLVATRTPTPTPTITPLPTALPLPLSAFEVLWTESSVNSGILWRADPRDIADRREVARFNEGILRAALSPDNRHIALTVGQLGDRVANPLWVVNVDGTNLRELVPSAGQVLWSQTGLTVFYSTGGEGWIGIEQVAVDSGKIQRVLTIEPVVGLSLLGWSADGQWLYHVRSKPSEHDLWKVRQDGSSAQVVVSLGADLPSPPYLLLSPDGRRLLFGTAQGLRWIATDGRGEEDIPLPGQGQGFLPLWGNEEQEVLVAQHDGKQALYHLYSIDLGSKLTRELGTFGIPNNGPGWVWLSISPDRQWLMGQLYPSGSYLVYFPSGLMIPLNFEYAAEFIGWIPREGQ